MADEANTPLPSQPPPADSATTAASKKKEEMKLKMALLKKRKAVALAKKLEAEKKLAATKEQEAESETPAEALDKCAPAPGAESDEGVDAGEASSTAAKMKEHIQIVTFRDWEGEFISQMMVPNKFPDALAEGFNDIAVRYGTHVRSLEFVYKDRVIPWEDYGKTTVQLGMDTGWVAEISVRAAEGAQLPPDAPILIMFECELEKFQAFAKPSWGLDRVCQLFCEQRNATWEDLSATTSFLWRGEELPINQSFGNSRFVRTLGMEEGEVITVADKDIVAAVKETDPWDFVFRRQRIASRRDVVDRELLVENVMNLIFGHVVDYDEQESVWIVEYDGRPGEERAISQIGLIKLMQYYKKNEERDNLPRVVGSQFYDVGPSEGRTYLRDTLDQFERFLLDSGGNVSLEALADYWSDVAADWIAPSVARYSMSTALYYLEQAGQPLDEVFTAIVRAHVRTAYIILHGEFLTVYMASTLSPLAEKRDLDAALEAFPNLRRLHEQTSTAVGMTAFLKKAFGRRISSPPILPQSTLERINFCVEDVRSLTRARVEGAAYHTPLGYVFALYAKQHQLPLEKLQFMRGGVLIDADETPASCGMKDEDCIYVFRKYTTVFANENVMKFHHQGSTCVEMVEDRPLRFVRLIDTIAYKAVRFEVGESTLLKEILGCYSFHLGISLRNLTLTLKGKMLFLSSAGKQTARELDIRYDDAIFVSLREDLTPGNEEKQPKPQTSKGRGKKKKRQGAKSKSKKKTQHIIVENEEEKLRQQHSQELTRVFEEADPAFRDIRQRLAAMNLERTLPKERKKKQPKPAVPVDDISNPPEDGVGGKAGKTFFIIQVGEVANLYTTTKPSAVRSSSSKTRRDDIMIDLHGLTKEQALQKLNESLPGWVDTAMKGEHPWVIPVKIVVGGGNQILAEAVEHWIKAKDSVSNAPKNLYE